LVSTVQMRVCPILAFKSRSLTGEHSRLSGSERRGKSNKRNVYIAINYVYLLCRLHTTERKRLFASVSLSSAAIEVDGGLPMAAGSGAALGGVTD